MLCKDQDRTVRSGCGPNPGGTRKQSVADADRKLAPHQAAGRLLASFVDGARPLSPDELAMQTGMPPESIGTVLDWLRDLELVQENGMHQHQLAEGRRRDRRRRFHLLMHLEPDAGVSSFCHVLLAENGYPSIGLEDSVLAGRVLRGVEFDLAVLSASGRNLAEYLDQEGELLHRLPPAPIILYGTEEDEDAGMIDSVAAILPGPLRGEALLAAVQTLLPSERLPSSEPPL